MTEFKKNRYELVSQSGMQKANVSQSKMQWTASSIFANMDKNHDGIVTGKEAESSGFSFMKNDKNVSAEWFEKMFNSLQEKFFSGVDYLPDDKIYRVKKHIKTLSVF